MLDQQTEWHLVKLPASDAQLGGGRINKTGCNGKVNNNNKTKKDSEGKKTRKKDRKTERESEHNDISYPNIQLKKF